MHPDTLLAMRMNGERLEASHGFPVRLLAPGWYGVASVKWLTQIEAINKPFDGYFQQVKYTVKRSTGHGVQSESVGKMPVKSEVIRPRDMEQIGIGTTRIFGLAWAGEDAVDAVEVSTNGGESWHRAELIGPRAPYSWNLWEYLWEVVAEGDYTLLSRTISEKGQVQPTKHDPLNAGYLINYSRPSRVQVDATQRSAALLGDTRTLEQEMSQLAEERAQLRLDVEMDLRYGAGI